MKPALLIMDFINELVHEKGVVAQMGCSQFAKENNVLENIGKLMQKARAKKIPIIHVKVGFSPDYKEWSPNARMFRGVKENKLFQLETWGTEFHESIDIQPHDFVVVKHRINPFYSTHLAVILQTLGADTVYLSGISTNYVVQSMAREAHDRDLNVIIVEDCCAALNQEEHDIAISSLKQMTVIKKENQLTFEETDGV